MLIYEVNLHVDAEIAGAYAAWLSQHIEEMLEIDGFERAVWYEVEEDGREHWSVHYYVESREALEAYFDGPAERMRGQGLERFQGHFSADRRVLAARQRFE